MNSCWVEDRAIYRSVRVALGEPAGILFPLQAGPLPMAHNYIGLVNQLAPTDLISWASPVFVDSCLGSLLINNTAF